MKTYIIERTVPGASELTEAELAGIAQTSNEAMETQGRPYVWLHTYAAGDRLICVHQAEDEEAVRAHSKCGGFPVDTITEVANTFDGTWAERLARA